MRPVMRHAARATILVLPLAACSDSDGDGRQRFSGYVKGLVAETAEDTEPEPIDELDVRFDEDPSAYDELFQ